MTSETYGQRLEDIRTYLDVVTQVAKGGDAKARPIPLPPIFVIGPKCQLVQWKPTRRLPADITRALETIGRELDEVINDIKKDNL